MSFFVRFEKLHYVPQDTMSVSEHLKEYNMQQFPIFPKQDLQSYLNKDFENMYFVPQCKAKFSAKCCGKSYKFPL